MLQISFDYAFLSGGLTVPKRYFICGSYVLFKSCVFMLPRLFIAALWSPAEKGHFPMWYPGSGVVLDCNDS